MMRVLWFTSTSSTYKVNKTPVHAYNGCGWISSLEECIKEVASIQLGIAFFSDANPEKKEQDNTTYYSMQSYRMNKISRIFDRIAPSQKAVEHELRMIETVIADFKPDIIHIFGTEYVYGRVYNRTTIPIIIHLQGILAPCYNAYYPIGINKWSIIFSMSDIKAKLLFNSLEQRRKQMKHSVDREIEYFQHIKYFAGRTAWDYQISRFLSQFRSRYFHVDEVLRHSFYERARKWSMRESAKKTIVTTISATIYKGLDLILKTSYILKKYSDLDFEWKVIGVRSDEVTLYEKSTGIKAKSLPIRFLGVKTADDIASIMLDSDVYVHPSYIDNSPNSLCEAQLLGLPVIGTDVGGVSSLIKHENTGILVPANAPYELSYWIQELCGNEGLSMRLSDNAGKDASIRHDKHRIVEQLLSSYCKMMSDIDMHKN